MTDSSSSAPASPRLAPRGARIRPSLHPVSHDTAPLALAAATAIAPAAGHADTPGTPATDVAHSALGVAPAAGAELRRNPAIRRSTRRAPPQYPPPPAYETAALPLDALAPPSYVRPSEDAPAMPRSLAPHDALASIRWIVEDMKPHPWVHYEAYVKRTGLLVTASKVSSAPQGAPLVWYMAVWASTEQQAMDLERYVEDLFEEDGRDVI